MLISVRDGRALGLDMPQDILFRDDESPDDSPDESPDEHAGSEHDSMPSLREIGPEEEGEYGRCPGLNEISSEEEEKEPPRIGGHMIWGVGHHVGRAAKRSRPLSDEEPVMAACVDEEKQGPALVLSDGET